MKIRHCLPVAVLACAGLLLAACQGTIEDPEIAALVDEYESLVEEHVGRIESSRGNAAQMAAEVSAFNADVSDWAEKFQARSKDISPEDARKVQRRMDDLNRRVREMITG